MAKEKTPFEFTVKSIVKDEKDGKHYYDYEMGKKFYRWKVTTEKDELVYVRKTEEHGEQPYQVGDHLKGMREEKENKTGKTFSTITKIEVVGPDGKPVTASKSTYNDPNVYVPKMRLKCAGAAVRVLLKLIEWERKIEEETGEVNKFHSNQFGAAAIQSMQKVFYTYISDDEKDINRDNMEIRLDCLHLAISSMEFPAMVHLKGNDEGDVDPATNRPVIKKKLSVKLVEQADAYYTLAK